MRCSSQRHERTSFLIDAGGAISDMRQRLSAVLEEATAEAHQVARGQSVAYVDETGAPTGNADGANPKGKLGWLWV